MVVAFSLLRFGRVCALVKGRLIHFEHEARIVVDRRERSGRNWGVAVLQNNLEGFGFFLYGIRHDQEGPGHRALQWLERDCQVSLEIQTNEVLCGNGVGRCPLKGVGQGGALA